MKRVGFLTKTIVLALLLLVFVFGIVFTQEQDKIVFGLNWIWYGVHGYFVPAQKLGFYDEVNLDVEIMRGYGSGDAIKRAFIGKADVVLSDINSLVVARSKGMEVKAIAVLENIAPHTVIARRDHGIKTLKDLEGKTFAGSQVDGNIIMLPTLCKLADVNYDKIKIVYVNSQSKDPLLLSGKIDAIGQFQAGGGTRYIKYAEKENIDIVMFPYYQYGFEAYGLSIMASDKIIKEKPDVLRRFLSATLKGIAWALDNPEKTIEMYVQFKPEMDAEDLEDGFKDARNLIIPKMNENGLGWFDNERVEYTVNVNVEAQNLAPVVAGEIYTNSLLPRIKPKSVK